MSQYLLLNNVSVQNANAIAGFTYGFPAITNFLGFSHALSRKLPKELKVSIGGAAVISHHCEVHAKQPKGWGDFVFSLNRIPLTKEGKTAPINEEGKMSMRISLLLEIKGLSMGDLETTRKLEQHAQTIIPTLRMAGGQIISIESINVTIAGEESKTLRQLMPGYALIDRCDYLSEHYENLNKNDEQATLFDAWCDFAKIKYKAEPIADEPDKAHWRYVPKPNAGYLVPIMSGYRAISPLYDPGTVENVRDNSIPVAFSEAAYSVGEWISLHRINTIDDAIWRYQHDFPWYVAKTKPFNENTPDNQLDEEMVFE